MENNSESAKTGFMVIPPDVLSETAFKGVLEEFILREGTDYGHSNPSLEDKRAKVIKQINKGHLKIVFCKTSETCTLMRNEEFIKKTESVNSAATNTSKL